MTGTEVEADPSVRPPEAAHPAPRVWQWLSGDEAVRRSTVLAWLALLAAVVFVVQGTVRFDFRDKPVAGDQTSYLLQALSLEGDGHNLSYDAADMDRWRDVGWVSTPTSLFFQRTPHGWAFAKPYGYSLLLAAFIAVFGVVGGVAAVGTFLVLVMTALSIAILRTRYRGPVIPLAVLALVITSYVYFYAYVISEDLFLAVVTAAISLLVLKAWSSRSVAWAGGAIALMVATIPEKPQFVALFAPMAIALLWRERSVTKKVLLVVVAAAAFFVASFPYRHYSDGSSWNAYQGDRYFTNGPTPFDHPRLAATTCPPVCAQSGEVSLTSVDGIRTRIEQGRGQVASFFYYFFGRYTGLLVFIPFALLALGVVMILYWRRLDGLAWATLAGIIAYILLNVVVYPNNYYGGGQSLGDRYFLQMAPFVLLLLVAARVSARAMLWISAVGIALGVVFLLPHHAHPSDAYVRIDQTSPLQRLLPIEANQEGVNYFRCPIYGDCAATATKIDGFRP